MEVVVLQVFAHLRVCGTASFEAAFIVAWEMVKVSEGIFFTVVVSVYAAGGSQVILLHSHTAELTVTVKLISIPA
jgi:hypothetical protein